MDGEWACERCTLINDPYLTNCEACHTTRSRASLLSDKSKPDPLQNREPQEHGSTRRSPSEERRIILLGRTGSGKSATGNNILGETAFTSSASGSSVTKKCQRGTAWRFGRNIQIIDSPGLFDTDLSEADITREIVKCVGMTAPGPHAFVLVVRIDRFTKEEQDTVEHFRQVFGEGMLNFLLVLFTRKDDLIHDKISLQEYLQDVPDNLRNLLSDCHGRHIAFNNTGSDADRDHDVQNFLDLVDKILSENGGNYYTSEMFAEAEKNIRQREAELKEEHEMRIKREKEEIIKRYEMKVKTENTKRDLKIQELQNKIKELEEEKKDSMAKQIKATLREVQAEREKANKELDMQRLREEREAEIILEAEQIDYREQARKEVNKEKSGVMRFLLQTLPNIVTAFLPSIVGKVAGLAGKVILKAFRK